MKTNLNKASFEGIRSKLSFLMNLPSARSGLAESGLLAHVTHVTNHRCPYLWKLLSSPYISFKNHQQLVFFSFSALDWA